MKKQVNEKRKVNLPLFFYECLRELAFLYRDFRELQIVGGNMRRREQREHIFKLLFISEFNTQKEMEEQLALYLADIENLKRATGTISAANI